MTTTESGFEWFNSGPSGGFGGDEWHCPHVTQHERIVGIDVSGDAWINSITLHIHIQSSDTVTSRTFGGDGGSRLLSFDLPESGRLVRISGTYGWYVNSLDFVVYDVRSGQKIRYSAHGHDVAPASFDYEAPDGIAIAALWGRAATYLDTIGVNYRPDTHPQR
jgi:hypothetical protein